MEESPDSGQAGVQISPLMIEAGVDELLSHDSEDLAHTNPRHIVRWIFEAMIRASSRGHVSTD